MDRNPNDVVDDDDDDDDHYLPHFPFWCGNYVIWGIPIPMTTGTWNHTVPDTDATTTALKNGDGVDGCDHYYGPTVLSSSTPPPPPPQLMSCDMTTTNNENHNHNNDHHSSMIYNNIDSSPHHHNSNSKNNINNNTRRTIHGLAIDVYGRATIGMSTIFLGPALLHLANIAAGCNTTNNNTTSEEDTSSNNNICTNTIYGFRPSSLLTNIAALSGMIGCIALPFIGSIMDHTSYRKSIGRISGMILCLIKIMEYIGLSNSIQSLLPNIWFYIAILQIIASVTFYTHLTAAYAYLSELSSIPQQQSHYNTSLFIVMYGSTLFFMIEVLLLSSIFQKANTDNENDNNNNEDNSDIDTAQTALFITIITCTACFYYSWTYCFPYATAKKVIPIDQSVYSAGFYTLYHTLQQLLWSIPNNTTSIITTMSSPSHHHTIVNTFDPNDENDGSMTSIQPQLNHDDDDNNNNDEIPHLTAARHHLPQSTVQRNHAMFYILCSVSFSEAAANAIIVISTTYMKEILLFNANQIGVVFLIVLLCGIPGSQWGRYVTTSLCSNNPVRSLMYCNVLFGTSTILAAMLLRGPQDIVLCYMFGGCWGMCLGWLQPQNTSSYVPVIPRNQEAEMMGLYLLACQIFSWLPPTIFTIMNELHISMCYGLGSLSIYFVISLICLFMVGDYVGVVNAIPPVDDPNHHHTGIEMHHSTNSGISDTEMTLRQRSNLAVQDTNDNDENEEDVYYPSSPLSTRLPDITHRELT